MEKVHTSMESDKPGRGVTSHEIHELGQICLFKSGGKYVLLIGLCIMQARVKSLTIIIIKCTQIHMLSIINFALVFY